MTDETIHNTSPMLFDADEELARALSMDSANISGLNQEHVAPENREERIPHLGVYYNRHPNATTKYRAAVRLGSGEKANYLPLGNFNDLIIAAMAYNVGALNKFGTAAWLNRVSEDMVTDHAEYAEWQAKRAGFIQSASKIVQEAHSKDVKLQFTSEEGREAAAAAG